MVSMPDSPSDNAAVVALQRCDSYERDRVRAAVRRCVAALPDLQERFRNARRVLLKPNLLSSTRGPEKHVNTHPEVVRAIGELLADDYGCALAIGDSCGTLTEGSSARAIRKSGMEDVCRDLGAEVYNVDTQPRHVHDFPQGEIYRAIPLPSNLDQFDMVVSVAKLKTHSLTGVTGPVKNIFGLVPGQAKKHAHLMCPRLDAFTTLLADLYACVRPGAAFVDGIVGMEGHGPANGGLRDVGMMAAGCDAVAVDSVAAQVMGFDPMQVATLAKCDARGLGVARPDAIRVAGEAIADLAPADYAKPNTYASNLALRILPRWLFRGMFSVFTSRYAQVNAPRCIACGECARNCPNKAISLDPGTDKYRVDRAKCICCYCCAEVCPVDAIDILQTLPARILGRIRHPLGGAPGE